MEVGQGALVYTDEALGETLTFYAATRSTNASSSKGLPPLPKAFNFDNRNSNFGIQNSQFARQEGESLIITGTGTLQVFDIMGRLLFNFLIQNSKFEIPISKFPSSGVYILRLGGKTQKMVVR